MAVIEIETDAERIKALELELEDIRAERDSLSSELDEARRELDQEQRQVDETVGDAVNRFLDTVQRPVGKQIFNVPPGPEVNRAILGLFDAVGRGL